MLNFKKCIDKIKKGAIVNYSNGFARRKKIKRMKTVKQKP